MYIQGNARLPPPPPLHHFPSVHLHTHAFVTLPDWDFKIIQTNVYSLPWVCPNQGNKDVFCCSSIIHSSIKKKVFRALHHFLFWLILRQIHPCRSERPLAAAGPAAAARRWSSLAGVNQSDRCGIINLKIHFFTQLAIASKNISHMKCLIMPYCHWKGYLICLVFFFCWLC